MLQSRLREHDIFVTMAVQLEPRYKDSEGNYRGVEEFIRHGIYDLPLSLRTESYLLRSARNF